MTDISVSFDIYDAETVRILQEEDPDLLPDYSVNAGKDIAYNKKQVTSAITSGIIKGESIPKIASNLQSTMRDLNQSSAIAAARTAAISAHNSGKLSTMKELAAMGVEVQKEWVATLDDRTRASHRALDGQRRELDEAFSNGLQYPGDSSGSAGEVWRCRCTMTSYMPKYDSEDEPRLTYSEWVTYKQATGDKARKINEVAYNRAQAWNISNALYEIHSSVAIPAEYDGDFSDYNELDLEPEEEQAFKELHKLTERNDCEYAVIFYDDTSTEIITSNEYDHVYVKGLKDSITNAHGLKIYHSHTNVTPLSQADLRQLCNMNVATVGCIALNGDTYVVSIGYGWRPTEEEYSTITNSIRQEVDREISERALDEGWSFEEARYMAVKEQCYRIIRAFDWECKGGRIDE